MLPHRCLPVIYTVHCRVLFNSSECFTAPLKVAMQNKVMAGHWQGAGKVQTALLLIRDPGLAQGQGDGDKLLQKLVAWTLLVGGNENGRWSPRGAQERAPMLVIP